MVLRSIVFTAAAACLAFVPGAGAAPPAPLQAAMTVYGELVVATDGSVASWEIRDADAVPQAARSVLDASIPQWRFRPTVVDGVPAQLRSAMSIRLELAQASKDEYQVRVSGANFYAPADPDAKATGFQPRPKYPGAVIGAGVSGTVFLVAALEADGRPRDVAVEQVDLYTRSSPNRLEHWRRLLAQASLDAARQWTFPVPEGADGHIVRTSIEFLVTPGASGTPPSLYQWRQYTRGPRAEIPWLEDKSGFAGLLPLPPDMVEKLDGPPPLELLTPLDQA